MLTVFFIPKKIIWMNVCMIFACVMNEYIIRRSVEIERDVAMIEIFLPTFSSTFSSTFSLLYWVLFEWYVVVSQVEGCWERVILDMCICVFVFQGGGVVV